MSDIQRWSCDWAEERHDPDGYWVTHADHLAAMQQATDRVRDEWTGILREQVLLARADALDDAIQAVEYAGRRMPVDVVEPFVATLRALRDGGAS